MLAHPGGASLLTPADLPRVAIEVDEPAPAAEPAAPSQSARTLDARLRFGAVTAPVELEVARWPIVTERGHRTRIDVEIKKGERFYGLDRLAFVDPAEQAQQVEPLMLEQLRREGVLAPRIGYAQVTLNGAALGVMAVRERISKELIESQQRRDGIVFRLDGDALPVARVDTYRTKKIAKSEDLVAQRDTAAGLLRGFLDGKFAVGEVFDVDLLARFLAVAELWRAEILVRPENLRFYLNPVTQRLEPVAYSGVFHELAEPNAPRVLARPWPAQLLADGEVRAATATELARLADEVAGEEPPAWWTEAEDRILAALRTADPNLARLDFGRFRARARAVASLPDAVAAGAAASAGAQRLGADPEAPALARNPVPRAELAAVLARHRFLAWDEQRRMLIAQPGTWTLRESLVLPEGAGLELAAGTTLRFAPAAMLLGSGSLQFHGTAEKPVVLEGIPQGDAPGSWQGVAVLRSASPHLWEHVVVSETTGIERDTFRLTAGVTLRASAVRMSHCTFRDNRTEDALNLIRSDFDFEEVSIHTTTSDAFDCDFCDGRLSGGEITDVGGDGIDVSGSVVEVVGVELRNVRDKAISVGERSRLVARRVRAVGVGTAVAVKDGSEALFEDSEVADVEHVAIMAYTKKREYGPGHITARNIRMSRVGRAALAQLGSRIEIDGVAQVAEDVDVESLYSKGYMQK